MACFFITQYFQHMNGAKTLTHIVLCTFQIKSNDNMEKRVDLNIRTR
jgi:hypothetical protein